MEWRNKLRQLILQRTGIEVPEATSSLDAFVNERLKIINLTNPEAYLSYLLIQEFSAPEWDLVIDAMTNRLTHFFRDIDQLNVVGRVLDSQRQNLSNRPLKVWSAGCSTGEEAYTLAMICKRRDIPVEILGTDVNPRVIAAARFAQYAPWTLRHVESELVETYFDIRPDGTYIPTSEISQMVCFAQHNLVTDEVTRLRDDSSGWDLILCRNVLIYYSRAMVAQIAQALVSSLTESGVLLLGASESLRHLQVSAAAQIVDGRIIYRPDSPRRKAMSTKPIEPIKPKRGAQIIPPIESPTPTAPKDFESYLQVQELLVQYIRKEQYDFATSCLKEVIDCNPKDTVANLSLGHTYMLLHNFDAAIKCYTTVATIDPLLSETHFFLGILERKRHRLEAAMQWLKRAVFLEPTFWAASYFLATTAQRLGKTTIWERERKRTVELLASSNCTLPMVSHPVLHEKFVPDKNEVIRSYYDTPIVKNAS